MCVIFNNNNNNNNNAAPVSLDDDKELELQDRFCAERLVLDSRSVIVQMEKFKVQRHVHAHACRNNAKSGCGT